MAFKPHHSLASGYLPCLPLFSLCALARVHVMSCPFSFWSVPCLWLAELFTECQYFLQCLAELPSLPGTFKESVSFCCLEDSSSSLLIALRLHWACDTHKDVLPLPVDSATLELASVTFWCNPEDAAWLEDLFSQVTKLE